jgi:hypothetical protein
MNISRRDPRLLIAALICLLLVTVAACSSPTPTPTPRPTATPFPTATPTRVKTVDEVTAALPTSKFLDAKHAAKGVQCVACHGTMPPKGAPEMSVCLGCHGGSYTALGDLTVKVNPNPHRSHNGELACTKCHHGHAPFEYYCGTCHDEFRNTRFQ